MPLGMWIKSGFTGIFHSHHFVKILDKVIPGSIKILAFVALVLVEHKYQEILNCESGYDAIVKLTDIPEEVEPSLIQSAIDRWSKDGHQLLAHHHKTSNATNIVISGSFNGGNINLMQMSDEIKVVEY